jgi:DnaJ-class molecular chaperone
MLKPLGNMKDFEQNEIDGIEAVDLQTLKTCTNCKGQKQFKKYTNDGLQYGYICPKCDGTGLEIIPPK